MPSDSPVDRLREIVENCDRIAAYTADMDFETYAGDMKTRDAVERCLARISEAACKIGSYIETRYPETDWAGARGVGNLLRHQYDGIEDLDIWNGVVTDVPRLRAAASSEIQRLISASESGGDGAGRG